MNLIYWGISAAFFFILELLIPSLVSIWFAISSIILMFISLIIKNIQIQILIFSIISIILILTTKLWIKKDKTNNKISSNVGDEVKILNIINNNEYEIKYKGAIWTAISNEEFNKNEIAIIKEYKGNKIIIERR